MVPPDDLAWTGAPTTDNAASDEDDSSVTQVIKGIGKRRKAQKKPAIKKKLSDTPRCLVCGQHGSLLECSTCAKVADFRLAVLLPTCRPTMNSAYKHNSLQKIHLVILPPWIYRQHL